jgi:cell division protein FtsW
MINMAVAVNLFPVTGQTLPIVSMGGTSMLFSYFALGIILSVSRGIKKENLKAEMLKTSEENKPEDKQDEQPE